MANKKDIGGILQTYMKYDPVKFPSPTQPPPDFVSPLMDQMLAMGSMRELTEEELARAIHLDPEQFKNLGPSIDMMQAILEDRKRKILATYETESVVKLARESFHKHAKKNPGIPKPMQSFYKEAVEQEQLYDLERLYYMVGDDADPLAQHFAQSISRLAIKYEIGQLAANYNFHGHESMTVPQALEIKEELEKIEELLEQLEEARKTAQIAILDMEKLGEFMDQDSMHSLEEMQRTIEEYIKQAAEQQGLQNKDGRY